MASLITPPTAVDAQAQFMQNCAPPNIKKKPNKKEKAVDGNAAEETTATSSSEERHFSKLNLIS